MATTVQDLLNNALDRSTANDPEVLVEDGRVVELIQRRIQELYVAAGLRYPMFFGDSSVVTGSSGVWTIPANALVLIRVDDTNGDEVPVVALEDLEAEMEPRLYRVGWELRKRASDFEPAPDADLTMFYAIRHPDLDPTLALDNAANTLDASWREEHNDILIDTLAIYLAEKDAREAEVARLSASVQSRVTTFLAHLDALAGERTESRV